MKTIFRYLLYSCVLFIISCKDFQKLAERQNGFVSLFNGRNLDGWEGDPTYWRVENGTIIGEVTPETLLERNSFLIWRKGMVSDFELKVVFKVSSEGNSGINYRSEEVEGLDYALKGYQADIDGKLQYMGMNYEERIRTTIAKPGDQVKLSASQGSLQDNISNNVWLPTTVVNSEPDLEKLKTLVKKNDWNEMRILAKGNVLEHYVNGKLFSSVTDEDEKYLKKEGLLGVQVHVGPPMKIEYKTILLKRL
ncbi:DUF1080 domain-containing protein [Sphingobacterium sp.]|uniref:3-keto-disaccharide hydrolase n=1 Tax=Sphingobacterium sp. TaxID=341027 RepID=UPI0028AC45FB|nr:DUF1080 domain-containing protein [Sphingobacterium sp.]